MSRDTIRVIEIIRGTTVDGPGFRTAIYLAGCGHACEGCHNPESWNPDAGKEMTVAEVMEIVREEDFDVTLTGGDPLYDPEATLRLTKAIHNEGYGIWLYTGYTIEEIESKPRLKKLLPYLDAIVDGPFVLSLRNSDLQYRGSSNQRIIRLKNDVLK